MRLGKLLVLVAVAALGPGSCLNSPPPRDLTSGLAMWPIPEAPPLATEVAPGVRWLEGWQLTSPNYHFGGYSAAVILRDGELMLGSDRGRLLVLDPDRQGAANARIDWLHAIDGADKHMSDLEALTLDPVSGSFWAAFEGRNMILKLREDQTLAAYATPPEISGWSYNSGSEAFARLAGGRFVALSESPNGWFSGMHEGVLFEGDPTEGARGTRFMLDVPDGFDPSDLAVLPNGRWLVLLRKVLWALPPRFESALLLIDPVGIKGGQVLSGKLLRFNRAMPPENYEGLAIVRSSDPGVTVWMVSDDNLAHFQRTLLVKLRLELAVSTKEKARGDPARRSEMPGGPQAD